MSECCIMPNRIIKRTSVPLGLYSNSSLKYYYYYFFLFWFFFLFAVHVNMWIT